MLANESDDGEIEKWITLPYLTYLSPGTGTVESNNGFLAEESPLLVPTTGLWSFTVYL